MSFGGGGFGAKPLALTCHLCGREYGTKSLPIHVPQCEAKWWKSQEVLPKWCQKPPPSGPETPLPRSSRDLAGMEAYNQEAWSIAQRALNQCPYCKRSFKPDSLVVHFNSCREKGDEDPFSPRRKAFSRPKALVCYICGQQFGTSSLEIHQKQCIIKWERQQELLPPSQRKPLPQPPKDSPVASPGGKIDFVAQNEAAFEAYQGNLVECENCGRTFAPDRLGVHQRSCKPGKPLKPRLTASSTSSSSPTVSSPAEQPIPQRRPGTPDISAGIPDASTAGDERVPCSKCGRKFAPDRIDRHESTCRVNPSSSSPNTDSPAARRNAYDPRASATATTTSSSSTASTARDSFGGNGGEDSSDLVPCAKCGRKFSPDRIDRHELACKGTGGSGGPGGATNPAARRNAYDPRAAAREAKAGAAGAGGASRLSLKERMAVEHAKRDDDRVECRVCGRKFASDRIDKHVSICSNLVNIDNRRPTSSMGRGLGGGGGGGRLNATTSPIRRPATSGGGMTSPSRSSAGRGSSPLRRSLGSPLDRPSPASRIPSTSASSTRGGRSPAMGAVGRGVPAKNSSPPAGGRPMTAGPAKFCHECGESHVESARFCMNCGVPRLGI